MADRKTVAMKKSAQPAKRVAVATRPPTKPSRQQVIEDDDETLLDDEGDEEEVDLDEELDDELMDDEEEEVDLDEDEEEEVPVVKKKVAAPAATKKVAPPVAKKVAAPVRKPTVVEVESDEDEVEEPEPAKAKSTIKVKSVSDQAVQNLLAGVMDSLNGGQSVTLTRTGDNSWSISNGVSVAAAAPAKAKHPEEFYQTDEYKEWLKEWKTLTPDQKKQRAKKAKASWEAHEDPRIDNLRMVQAVLEALGISKYKPEFQTPSSRR